MHTPIRHLTIPALLLALAAAVGGVVPLSHAQTPQPGCRAFPQTGKSVCGRFLQYWDAHGGLAQQGYPVSGEFQEASEIDGKTYTVQYFERAVFEAHPENKAPYDVLLSLLGRMKLEERYPGGAPDGDKGLVPGESLTFPQTGKMVSGAFLKYWREHGGLAQQGYPISNAMYQGDTRAAPPRIVQYFERAVFELHPENDEPFSVLLSRLGAERFEARYPNGEPVAGGDVWATLRARPLKMTSIAAGSTCPAEPARAVNPKVGLALGTGPAYPVGFSPEGVYDYGGTIEEGGWYLLKVLWVADPDAYSGPILIRGRQIDGPGELRFDRGDDPPKELQLDASNSTVIGEGDWPNWPSYTRLRTPGCYAYQIDGTSFSNVITFRAQKGP
ncbi:MAG: hypothetical protein WCD37_11475 [Chloroflexia bacterium]